MHNFLWQLLLLILVSLPAFGRNIVLLTSMPEHQANYAFRAERVFMKKTWDFAEEFQIIVEHEADQEILYKYLNDPETLALFWVSHGGYKAPKNAAAIRMAPVLVDHNLDNVAKVFGKIHPNVKFVGVIGCYTSQILAGIVKDRADLDGFFTTGKTLGQFALRRAIKHFRYTHYRKDNSPAAIVVEEGMKVKVSRHGGKKSLKVFASGELVTVLPATDGEYEIEIPLTAKKLMFESGEDPLVASESIGQLSLPASWKLFAKKDGTPFGTNDRIYNYILTGEN